MTWPGKTPSQAGFEPQIFHSQGGRGRREGGVGGGGGQGSAGHRIKWPELSSPDRVNQVYSKIWSASRRRVDQKTTNDGAYLIHHFVFCIQYKCDIHSKFSRFLYSKFNSLWCDDLWMGCGWPWPVRWQIDLSHFVVRGHLIPSTLKKIKVLLCETFQQYVHISLCDEMKVWIAVVTEGI